MTYFLRDHVRKQVYVDFRGQVWKHLWTMIFFGLKESQDLKNWMVHQNKEFPGVSPGVNLVNLPATSFLCPSALNGPLLFRQKSVFHANCYKMEGSACRLELIKMPQVWLCCNCCDQMMFCTLRDWKKTIQSYIYLNLITTKSITADNWGGWRSCHKLFDSLNGNKEPLNVWRGWIG